MTTFTVDTHLFRELGELLVGRDSTALVELIKNSYDADATEVVVYGEGLTSASRGIITIRDNGIGMSPEEFESGFLRIAARTKETNKRKSAVFERRYTGAKGIGRLAAHKLARSIEIESFRWSGQRSDGINRGHRLQAGAVGLHASIDWDLIEAQSTLEDVDKTNAIVVKSLSLSVRTPAGTTITLRRIRRRWTQQEHSRFLEEVQAFEPPQVLVTKLPASVLREPLLFERPVTQDIDYAGSAPFSVRLEGELAPSDDYWTAVAGAANWVIEINADRKTKKVRYAIAPTAATLREYPAAAVRVFEINHPLPEDGPFFHARILKRVGVQQGDKELRSWAGRIGGVKVFMEGFRVLPYGERSNDWLSLDADVGQRDRGIINRDLDPQLSLQFEPAEKDPDAGLNVVGNKHFVGGVFLTERNARSLKMLVNREGFVPETGYHTLVSLVRQGIDLCSRVQAAATVTVRHARRELRAEKHRDIRPNDPALMPTAAAIVAVIRDAQTQASEAKRLIAGGRFDAASRTVQNVADQVEKVSRVSNELAEEQAMVRVLASVGTQLASFVHEINGLLGIASAVDIALGKIRESTGLSALHKRELGILHRSVGDLKRSLERQSSYLIDVVTPDARRRRSRLPIAKQFDASVKLIDFAAERRRIKIINRIPTNLKSPPMFRAELATAFSNLLTNAVKAAGEKGRIQASGRQTKDGVVIRLENTGVRVRLKDAESWFRPFESSTTEVDPVLGQGMGLGLTITRSMLEEYGATIKFVDPGGGFATAIEISFSE